MQAPQYDRGRATRLLPLLNSITREIEERSAALAELEARMSPSEGMPFLAEDELHNLVAEAAMHRRELRHAKEELLALGCSIVGTEPITIRIPGHLGSERRSFVYRTGDPVLR
jgi:hypothetical protein